MPEANASQPPTTVVFLNNTPESGRTEGQKDRRTFFASYCSPNTEEDVMSEPDNFRQRVFQIIAAIPSGQVTTYGNVAQLAGSPRAARQVGGVLKKLPEGSSLPWHRVINRHGEISLQGEDFKRQRQALLAEGIIFKKGKVDLEKYGWKW
jgi:methylated-DNA-protein-cysteine methyltransferase-like protein